MGGVKEGSHVAIWGASPVGILSAHCSFHLGAARVVIIDQVKDRLQFAASRIERLEVGLACSVLRA